MAVAAAPQPTRPPGRTGEGGGRVRLDQKSRMMVMALPQPVVVCDVVWVYRAKVCVCVCVCVCLRGSQDGLASREGEGGLVGGVG